MTIHSYRHRYGNTPGDPAFDSVERLLAALPLIPVPTIVLQGDANGVVPEAWRKFRGKFTGPAEQRVFADVGHNIPSEAREIVADAVLDLLASHPA